MDESRKHKVKQKKLIMEEYVMNYFVYVKLQRGKN